MIITTPLSRLITIALITVAFALTSGCKENKKTDSKKDPKKENQTKPQPEPKADKTDKTDKVTPAKTATKAGDKAEKPAKTVAAPATKPADKPADKPATPVTAKVAPTPSPVVAATTNTAALKSGRALVDEMAAGMKKMLGEIKAAGTDVAKVKQIQQSYVKLNAPLSQRARALQAQLSPGDKKALRAYAKLKMQPIMKEMMQVMMKSGALKPPGAAAKGPGTSATKLKLPPVPKAPKLKSSLDKGSKVNKIGSKVNKITAPPVAKPAPKATK
jgi:hypothetical protein